MARLETLINPKVAHLLKRISQHFHNESEIMMEITETDLSDEDWKLIQEFMLTHPHHYLVEKIRSVRSSLPIQKI